MRMNCKWKVTKWVSGLQFQAVGQAQHTQCSPLGLFLFSFSFFFFYSFTDSTRILRICRMSKLAPLILLRQGKWFFCSYPSSSIWISHGQTKAVDFHQGWVPKTGLGDIQDRPGEFNALSIDVLPAMPLYLQRHHVTQPSLRGLSALKICKSF